MRAQIITWGQNNQETRLRFWCPGCDRAHAVPVDGSRGWSWNGSEDRPTITPSILHGKGTADVCHMFVTDGMAKFCGDSTHKLSGQEVPLPDLIEIGEEWQDV